MKKQSPRFLIASAIVAFLTIIGVALYKYATDSPHRISSEEAKRRISAKEIDVVLDVRTDTELGWQLISFMNWDTRMRYIFLGNIHLLSN